MIAHEAYVWMKEVTSSNSCAFDASCHRELEKAFFLPPLESSQVSLTHVRSILWFGDLQPSLYMYP